MLGHSSRLPYQNSKHTLVVAGGGGVGKSALTLQFIQGEFIDEYDPTIEDCYRKQIQIDSKPAILDILDTAGQEEYSALREQYMRKGDGFLLCYAIDNPQSLLEASNLLLQIRRVKESEVLDNHSMYNNYDVDIMDSIAARIPIILVATKCDLEMEGLRLVSREDGIRAARTFGVPYIETSARARFNVVEAFEGLVRLVREVESYGVSGNSGISGSTGGGSSLVNNMGNNRVGRTRKMSAASSTGNNSSTWSPPLSPVENVFAGNSVNVNGNGYSGNGGNGNGGYASKRSRAYSSGRRPMCSIM
ncbi:Ras GTPase [Blyttiomyces sp. JEL0837]|nr:Ras GTPase [Blyttiomyces sp. JEL0837]